MNSTAFHAVEVGFDSPTGRQIFNTPCYQRRNVGTNPTRVATFHSLVVKSIRQDIVHIYPAHRFDLCSESQF